MAKVGRPRALDELKRREVCALVSTGFGIAEAAEYIGCTARTVRREALRNEAFHESLRKAEIAGQLDALGTLRKAAGTEWRAAAWLLERTNPERFARRDTKTLKIEEVDDLITQLVEMVAEEIDDPDVQQRVYQRLLAATQQLTQESFAADHPRRDPKRARRMLGG